MSSIASTSVCLVSSLGPPTPLSPSISLSTLDDQPLCSVTLLFGRASLALRRAFLETALTRTYFECLLPRSEEPDASEKGCFGE